MKRSSISIIQTFFISVFVLTVTACATFDKTNILPGQEVPALGFTFEVPDNGTWFAVQYGNSHLIHLSQINRDDSYSIKVTLNKGPYAGMYKNVEEHLRAFKRSRALSRAEKGFIEKSYQVHEAPDAGKLCIKHTTAGENWHGRNNAGPALIERFGLACAHKNIDNVIVSIILQRRYETYADKVDLKHYADQLFASIEYDD